MRSSVWSLRKKTGGTSKSTPSSLFYSCFSSIFLSSKATSSACSLESILSCRLTTSFLLVSLFVLISSLSSYLVLIDFLWHPVGWPRPPVSPGLLTIRPPVTSHRAELLNTVGLVSREFPSDHGVHWPLLPEMLSSPGFLTPVSELLPHISTRSSLASYS